MLQVSSVAQTSMNYIEFVTHGHIRPKPPAEATCLQADCQMPLHCIERYTPQ